MSTAYKISQVREIMLI